MVCFGGPRYLYSGTDCALFICECKVRKLGFKSVAHYLIKTRRLEKNTEGSDSEIVAQETPEASPDSTLIRSVRTRRASRS